MNNMRLEKKIFDIKKSIKDHSQDLGIYVGNIGLALFYYVTSNERSREEDSDYINEKLTEAIEAINQGFAYPTFCSGLAGIGWAVNYFIKHEYLDEENIEILDALDLHLYQTMIEYLKSREYDYLHGAIGIALYFTSRKINDKMTSYLTDFINTLKETAVIQNNYCYWIKSETSSVDTSLSHGQASILNILSRIYKLGIKKDDTGYLIKLLLNYFDSIKNNINENNGIFPITIGSENTMKKGRLAWCYGDLGIGITMLISSLHLNDNTLKEKAIEILKITADRKNTDRNGVMDSCFCHGSSGIAYIFKKAYNLTGESIFKETAEYWLDKTMEFAKFQDGLAGYKTWGGQVLQNWKIESGILEGIAGVGLVLNSFIVDNNSDDWDEIFMLNVLK